MNGIESGRGGSVVKVCVMVTVEYKMIGLYHRQAKIIKIIDVRAFVDLILLIINIVNPADLGFEFPEIIGII